MIRISVIIPTYGRPNQLKQCLAALALSDFPSEEFEVIVVDDGSPEPVGPQLSEFAALLQLTILRQKNAGGAAARNLGARHARGPTLAFIDDDCLPEQKWLRALEEVLAGSLDLLVGGRTVNAAHTNVYARVSHILTYRVYESYQADPSSVRFFATNNIAISKRTLLEQEHGFNERLRPAYEDRDLCGRMLRHGRRLAYQPDAVVAHNREMTLRSFIRQHLGYGRAAYSYYRESGRSEFGPVATRLTGFLMAAIRDAAAQSRGLDRVWAPVLAVFAQVASSIGFVSAAVATPRR